MGAVLQLERFDRDAMAAPVFRQAELDAAFAEGVAAVAPERMEYVITNAGMGRKRRIAGCRVVTLDDLSPEAAERIIDLSRTAASAARVIEAYRTYGSKNVVGSKGAYLVRDTLKVVGDPANDLAPATAALFYVRDASPLSGGTGHTIRVCQAHAVPVAFQADWLHWPRSRSRLRSPPCSRAAPLSAACG